MFAVQRWTRLGSNGLTASLIFFVLVLVRSCSFLRINLGTVDEFDMIHTSNALDLPTVPFSVSKTPFNFP